MYHPSNGGTEYVEVVNTRATSESLDQWTLRGDVEFNFGPAITLGAGESVLMVPFDPVLSPAAWIAQAASAGTDSGGIHGWQREYFPTGGPRSGAMEDCDLDGIANRLEYLLGTDPHSADAPPWSVFPADASGGQDLVLEYRLRRDRTDFPLIP